MSKTYTVTLTSHRTGNSTVFTGSIVELTEKFAYTLECGAGYSHEKGNAKINRKPGTLGSLIKNLNNAVNNSAANGYAGKSYA
tara:strand:+ start:6100 stop:6348 length:249 start_codon:yes stop_codon:yes gene_type:complete